MGSEILRGETPLWFIALGILTLLVLAVVFWHMRASLGGSSPFPDEERPRAEDESYMPFWAKLTGGRRRR